MANESGDNRPIFDPLEKHLARVQGLWVAAYEKLLEAAKAVERDAPEAVKRHELLYHIEQVGAHYNEGGRSALNNLLAEYRKRGDELGRLR
jgi:hypothetical protein